MDKFELLINKLSSCISDNHFPQTVLLYGSSVQNLEDFLLAIAQDLIQPKRIIEKNDFISLCRTNRYIDFINVFSIGSVKVDDIHDIENKIQYAPYESANRIVFFKDAAILTPQAQNALLKKIEEPPQRTFFVFAVNQKNSLLPTIISRTVKIFVPEANSEVDPNEASLFFPFLKSLNEDLGDEFYSAENTRFSELAALDPRRVTVIDKIYKEIVSSNNDFEAILSKFNADKSEYLRRMLIKMRLALYAFHVRKSYPEIAGRIVKFLNNQQYFSPDCSVFFNLIGEKIG